jgi:hypothetical protein
MSVWDIPHTRTLQQSQLRYRQASASDVPRTALGVASAVAAVALATLLRVCRCTHTRARTHTCTHTYTRTHTHTHIHVSGRPCNSTCILHGDIYIERRQIERSLAHRGAARTPQPAEIEVGSCRARPNSVTALKTPTHCRLLITCRARVDHHVRA